MTTPRKWSLAVVLAGFATGWTARLLPVDDKTPGPGSSPRLVNSCLITNDVKRLVEFYEPILALEAKKTGEDYAEFPTGVSVGNFLRRRSGEVHSWLSRSGEEQKRCASIPRGRCRSRIPETAGPCENLGKATHHPALGNSVHLLP